MGKIMAFGAHPDDIEFCCAGTLAKYRAAGWEVGIAVTTNGEVGSATLGKPEIAAVRHNEARASAELVAARSIRSYLRGVRRDSVEVPRLPGRVRIRGSVQKAKVLPRLRKKRWAAAISRPSRNRI